MRIVFLFIAIAISAAAAFFTYNMIKGKEQAQQGQAGLVVQPQVVEKEVPTQLVYVARGEIRVGDIIQQEMLDRQPWPRHLVGPGFVTVSDQAPRIVGMVARTPFAPGEVVLDSKLANPQDPSFIAASIPDGTRAITIQVNPISGVAGLIFPGDRVDVMLTHTLYGSETMQSVRKRMMLEALTAAESDDEEALKRVKTKFGIITEGSRDNDQITEVIIPDVRVVAVNQRAVITPEDNKKREAIQNITLEVLKEDAQRLKLAERLGQINLALRSLHDKSAALPDPSIEGDLTRTVPPGYFAKLFGFEDPAPKNIMNETKKQMDYLESGLGAGEIKTKTKETVTVVRGVKVEEIEFPHLGDRR